MAEASRTRAVYIRQAALIFLGIVVAVGTTIYVFDHGGSGWWLLIGYLAAAIPSGPMMLTTLNQISAVIGSQDGPFVIIGFAVLLVLLPVLASVFLIVALVQIVRHR